METTVLAAGRIVLSMRSSPFGENFSRCIIPSNRIRRTYKQRKRRKMEASFGSSDTSKDAFDRSSFRLHELASCDAGDWIWNRFVWLEHSSPSVFFFVLDHHPSHDEEERIVPSHHQSPKINKEGTSYTKKMDFSNGSRR